MASEADKYEVLERIGQGSFGIIRKVRRKNDALILCRKEICYSKMSQKEREQLQAELDILKRLNHPNIVRYYEREHHKASHDLHLYMEYCGNGDLGIMIKDLKARQAYADEELVWTIFAQLVSALYLCHYGEDPPDANGNAVGLARNALPLKSKQAHQTILHRDLKPENVFLGEGNAVKLGDFGLSKIILSHDFASTYVGTPFYMSPEICAAERYSLFSDIWSLGCIIYELCAKEPPFNAKTHFDLIQKIKLGKVAPLPRPYSRELQDVISACLQVNPNARPDTASLLNLPRVKMVRKSQQNAMMLHQHVLAKDQALKELEVVKERLVQMQVEREAERQALHEQLDRKLRLEWETRASLEINRQVRLAEEKLELVFNQKLEEEVERRVASFHDSHTSSQTSYSASSGDQSRSGDPIPRSSTPTAALDDNATALSLATVSEIEEDDGTDLTSLSLEDSPLVQRHKPMKKPTRTPFTRARTFANANEVAPSPMDIHMADPSPMSIKSLSLSPRRTVAIEGSKLRQPALRGVNIFDKAAMREGNAPLFPTHEVEEGEADDDNDDDAPSPTRLKLGLGGADPFKVLALPSSGGGRPGLTRQRTMPVQMHTRLKSTPNLFGPIGVHRSTPASLPVALPERPSSASSPRRTGIARGTAVSPSRKAPPPPAQPSATALSAKKAGNKDDMLKAIHRSNLQGRTLVELAQARGIPVQGAHGGSGGFEVDEDKVAKGERVAARMMEPLWDPERDEMPSPFLVKSRKTLLSR